MAIEDLPALISPALSDVERCVVDIETAASLAELPIAELSRLANENKNRYMWACVHRGAGYIFGVGFAYFASQCDAESAKAVGNLAVSGVFLAGAHVLNNMPSYRQSVEDAAFSMIRGKWGI